MNDKTMSAGEVVAALRGCPTAECAHCDFYAADARTDCGLGTVAADLIEAKEAELARVTEELATAVSDLHSMHTLCMDIGGCCPECGGQIDELLDAACTFCKGPGVSCWKNDMGNGNKCAAFEWRGPRKEA